MDSLKMQTPNLVDANIEKIAALFPNCITEDRDENGSVRRVVDFDLLRQELSASLVEGPRERYNLSWPGKKEAILTANAPIAKTLRPCREESVDFDSTHNIFIEGDNLDALKLLQETYLNKIKMIYIDPPYNTGNDFIYEDDFAEDTEAFLQRSNQKDEHGNRLIANTESNGRFHSDWLTMMYPRLKLARNLLREDGLIIISIDDNEAHNLRKVCDEIFGEDNFIDCVIWKKRYGGGAKEKYLISVHEYALVYAKSELKLENIYIPLTEESIKRYYIQKDENYQKRGPYRTHPLEATKSMGERLNLVFPIPAPDGTEVYPKRQWLWGQERVEKALSGNELEFIKDKNGGWSVHTKQYLKEEDGSIRQGKAFSLIDDVYTQHGTNEIIELFGNAQIFSFPKPSRFLQKLIQLGVNRAEEAIILDFFSGCATTAHAVLDLNKDDLVAGKTGGSNRKFIMVQIPEPCDEKSESFKAGYKTIAEIGKERIRRAGKKIKEENPITAQNLDIGFRVFKIDTSNMKDVYYTPDELKQGNLELFKDHIKPDRSPEDLLFQVFIDWGLDLTLPIAKETIDGKTVFLVDRDRSNALVACFDSGITEEFVKKLARYGTVRALFRDDAFGSDSVKINVEQIFKLLSPGTEVKSI
jgi:adenine-specific DNA-methyltransferase